MIAPFAVFAFTDEDHVVIASRIPQKQRDYVQHAPFFITAVFVGIAYYINMTYSAHPRKPLYLAKLVSAASVIYYLLAGLRVFPSASGKSLRRLVTLAVYPFFLMPIFGTTLGYVTKFSDDLYTITVKKSDKEQVEYINAKIVMTTSHFLVTLVGEQIRSLQISDVVSIVANRKLR
jgi:hypothetical protein